MIAEGDDKYLSKWIEQQLETTMGARPLIHDSVGAPMAASLLTDPAHCAAELGKGVVLGLEAFGPLKSPLVHQWGHSDIIGKQVYGEEDIAALMDFSHVQCGHQLQDIWTYVNSSQGKRIDAYKHQIMARMK